jgi:formylglycine-generating enzyme required for sulfatase activity
VLRGGSWYDDAGFLCAAYRDGNYPDDGDDDIGFRCVRR